MANTYSKIYLQFVFAVRGRQSLIKPEWENHLFRYITGIVKGKDQHLIAINGVSDHIHVLIRIRPTCVISDLIREVKKASTTFMKEEGYVADGFRWQEGYGVFSHHHKQVPNVVQYIENQKWRHGELTFEEEYVAMLEENEIEYKREYLFDWFEVD